MSDALGHPDGPLSPGAQAQLDELRTDALRLFLALAAGGFLAWHYLYMSLVPTGQATLQSYAVFAAAVPVLAGAYVVSRRSRVGAAALFVGGGMLAVAWTAYVLRAPDVVLLYALLALVAAFVVHPRAGLAVAALGVAACAGLGRALPGLLGPADVWRVAAFAGVAVAGVWVVVRQLSLALTWYVDGFAEAQRRTAEAREHRAQLVQTWRQLDSAYYRVERANAALQLAWRAADEAERSKMELVANISHELRTPLNLIVGFSEMMMTAPRSYGGATLPLPYRGDLNAIYRSAQHLLSLTDDVLDLARLETGRLGLLREPVDVRQIAQEACALVRDYAESKGLALQLAVSGDIPTLLLDRVRIRQVLLNLLTNAARATERGYIRVAVTRGEQVVRIEVADTGPGIPLADQRRIFERFVSKDRPGPSGPGGIGLGLPISKRFVELHGGDMGVEGQPGMGTTFWLTVPVAAAEGGPVGDGADRPLPRLAEHTVVLAHHDVGLARLLQRHLEGCRVEVVTDASDAEARALELKAAAVIAEPGEAAIPDEARVTVIRCPLPHLGRVATGLGAADYLVKPVTREALTAALRRLDGPVERVLVADDDVHFVRLLVRMLASDGLGHAVTTAHNGEDALARLRSERPDVLLLDLMMPGLDGYGVLERLAAEPELAATKVVVISAHGEAEATAPLGDEVSVRKPRGFRLAELTRLLSAVVREMDSARPRPDDPPGGAGGMAPERRGAQPG